MAEVKTPDYSSAAAQHHCASADHDSFRNRSRAQRVPPAQVGLQFLAMVNAYQATGGLAWVGDLEAMFMLRSTGSVKDFSEAIASRQVVQFQWQDQVWLPLFQFDLIRMQTYPALAPVLGRLKVLYNDWEIADWFSQANPWLKGHSPAYSLLADPAAVMDAACAETFIVRG